MDRVTSTTPQRPIGPSDTDGLTRLVESTAFANAILLVILVNAVLVGWETYIALPPDPPPLWIWLGLKVCLWLFVVELALKLADAARHGRLPAFFKDGWNLFDVTVVAGSFIPAVGPLAPILRVVRVLRVFRLVRSIPELRLIVTVLLRSIVSMKYIALLGAVIFYIYAVIGVQSFGRLLPEYATLHEALFTLFRVLTGDNWTDLRYAIDRAAAESGTAGLAWKATAFHVSWIVVSTFLLINLIVGAVLNNYQEVQQIERTRKALESGQLNTTDAKLRQLVRELDEVLAARAMRDADRDGG